MLGVGLSSFVSVGNSADLSDNDLLELLGAGPGHRRRSPLPGVVRRSPQVRARCPPVWPAQSRSMAVKSGRSAAGARATCSHTGALVSASDVTVDALFEQAGVIRTDTLNELFDVAELLSSQPVPRGDRVAIVTNAGGPGIMCADACQAGGVQVPVLPSEIRAELAEFLPSAASLVNPIDMIATAAAEDYRRTLRVLAMRTCATRSSQSSSLPSGPRRVDVAAAIREAAETTDGATIAAVFMTSERAPAELRSRSVHVPGYDYPEDAARAIALAARHGRWRSRPEGSVVGVEGARPEKAAAIITRQLAAGPGWLAPEEAIGAARVLRLAAHRDAHRRQCGRSRRGGR